MAQIFDPLPSNSTNPILCCYVNATSRIQIARITNIPDWYFERVVFPGQRLVFEALPEAQLEIHCGMMASAILSDTIPCDRLCIQDELSIQDELILTPDTEIVPALCEALVENQHPTIRRSAAEELGKIGSAMWGSK